MIKLTIFILTSLLLGFVYSDTAPIFVSDSNTGCPQIKCRANCGDTGYVIDENGCQTCKCVTKAKVECSKVMCRMFCENGFKRDENGCEICACNQLPQPCPELNCEQSCDNGYRKDYSGCQTCECIDKQSPSQQQQPIVKCEEIVCDLDCKYGYQRDESGCQQCACNRCLFTQCRMYCMYGFRKNEDDGCEVCECDWSPVAEKIQCDERIPCPGARVCNLNLRLCEIVSPDRVNWFLYDFQVDNDIFNDDKFVQTFKNGLIHNIATKYDLSTSQITVSSVEEKGLTSFQIMPFFNDDMNVFEKKMDQIDIDLNSHEFRKVLPAVTRVVENNDVEYSSKQSVNKWCRKFKNIMRSTPVFFGTIIILGLIAFIVLIGYINNFRRRGRFTLRSDSKLPIYDASYTLTPNDDDSFHAVHAPDGTKYVVIESDDMQTTNDKRALV